MCGITGFLDRSQQSSDDLLSGQVLSMMNVIRHRGPDDSGVWTDSRHGIVLGFRRLAILDLSPTGHQPMLSSNGRYIIVYNGEVYNYQDLRERLEHAGHLFRGTSDTEVILAGIVEWGVEKTVIGLNGMFAIALWDRQERILHLIRDRLGIKPLYYGWCGGVLLFGSEIKALRAHPSFEPDIDRDALAMYMRYTYIPAPFSIYKKIKKLLPGTMLTVEFDQSRPVESFHTYWSAAEIVGRGVKNPFRGTTEEAVRELDTLLRESVRLRMIADVPLGAFLSGGIDSSLIVALMQIQSHHPVKTFTIGFWESKYNEADHAKKVAHHLGTDHTELYVSPREALDVIPQLPFYYDEPFGDSSQIPTCLVAKLARGLVTVSLSGDGGDELFGGYSRYFRAENIWGFMGGIPIWLRRMLGGISRRLSESMVNREEINLAGISTKFYYLSEIMNVEDRERLYLRLVSQWNSPGQIVIDGNEPVMPQQLPAHGPPGLGFIERMMYLDLVTYLPEDILVKLDRASMGVSLESRVPYLDDHRVVEFAWSLPHEMKVRHGRGKWILRQILNHYVPGDLVGRPKMGFGVPVDSWLRGPLRDWAEALLDSNRLKREGYLNPAQIHKRWIEHRKHLMNWQYPLWPVLMFQSWLEQHA